MKVMKFGIDRLLEDAALRRPLAGKRVALLAHPASVTRDLLHSLDALSALDDINLTAAFGPQHGLRGDKQDNMIESPDFDDPVHGIPVFSLYGEVRRPTDQSMGTFDVILIDLQDLGCRIYTFITTLRYMLEAAAEHGKAVWVLDRPNPAGRPVEGTILTAGWESFVGAGPMPMRHGLTMGEMGRWMIAHFNIDVDYEVIEMEGWQPEGPGHGWPEDRLWINPSPNAPNVNMPRAWKGQRFRKGGGPRARWSYLVRRISMPGRSLRKCSGRRRNGSRAARCGKSGSSRPFTSIRDNCATASISMRKGRFMTTRLSVPGGCRRWR